MKQSQPLSIALLILATAYVAHVSAKQYGTSVTVTSTSQVVTLFPEDYLGSLTGVHLIFETNCNLVLYDKTTAIWSSGSAQSRSTPECRAIFQNDGNFVVYASSDTSPSNALWSSNTAVSPEKSTFQIKGTDFQVAQTFNSNYTVIIDICSRVSPAIPPLQPATPNGIVIVNAFDKSDFIIQEQQYLGSLDGIYASFQHDCNFVVYNGDSPLWATDTQRNTVYSCQLIVGRDGNLAITAKGHPDVVFWSTKETTQESKKVISTKLAVEEGYLTLSHTLSDGSTTTFIAGNWAHFESGW